MAITIEQEYLLAELSDGEMTYIAREYQYHLEQEF